MTKFVPVKLAHEVCIPACEKNLTPVLFLHGLSSSKSFWKNITQTVADKTGRKTYSYDARNHGDSEKSDAFDFDMLADDLFHFMDTLNIPKAILVGHSMGGITAIKAALREPHRVEMLFVEDMFVKKIPKELIDLVLGGLKLYVASVLAIPKEIDESKAKEHALEIFLSKLPHEIGTIINKEKFNGAEIVKTPDGGYDVKYNHKVVLRAAENIDTTMSEAKGCYDGPTFFIYGSLSPFLVGKEEKHIKLHFPEAKLIEFEEATHNVHGEFPEKFSETIIQCMNCS